MLKKPKILLITPPITQLNTPYPATAYLTGFLRQHRHDVCQSDLSIELVHRLFSKESLSTILKTLMDRRLKTPKKNRQESGAIQYFLKWGVSYLNTVEPTLNFLQGNDPSLALRISSRNYLPEGPRFASLEHMEALADGSLDWAFGELGIQDKAKYLASLYLDDLADVIYDGIDRKFSLARYGDKLAAAQPTFDPIEKELMAPISYVDQLLVELTHEALEKHKPDVVGITVPFPGNVYAAFRIAYTIKKVNPSVKTLLGGGVVNTELRSLKEPKVFDYFDYVLVDDGEKPLLKLLDNIANPHKENLQRTYRRENNEVIYLEGSGADLSHSEIGTPTYDGLPLDKYLSINEMLNPMHRIWSDGRWNKLTLAHGCYWRQCSFCDVNLDYINRYDEAKAEVIVDRMQTLIKETGQTGFHFVDEAAPPKIMLSMAKLLIERGITVTWWGNVRFEKAFTPRTAAILAESGCVAVSGGLEVASDRLLKLMNKGVTINQVTKATKALTDAGIMVHAYLMYGFPTQTPQETVDALEIVRQLFEEGCIQSGFWHRFAATTHSPVGKNPENFGIITHPNPDITFADNDLDFTDPTPADHDMLGKGLRKALYNYMHQVGFDMKIESWFEKEVPRISIDARRIHKILSG